MSKNRIVEEGPMCSWPSFNSNQHMTDLVSPILTSIPPHYFTTPKLHTILSINTSSHSPDIQGSFL